MKWLGFRPEIGPRLSPAATKRVFWEESIVLLRTFELSVFWKGFAPVGPILLDGP